MTLSQLTSKTIPDWRMIRETIDSIEDSKSKNILRISYLFGNSIRELVRGGTQKGTIKGNDFFTRSIDGNEALVLRTPTMRRGGKPRYIAVPLNPDVEPWSRDILKISEECGNDPLYKNRSRSLQRDIAQIYFINHEWPSPGYKEKKNRDKDKIFFTHKHLKELREWELGLCHNFTEYDFKHFFGEYYNSDYNAYFNKLLFKSDYYESSDIINAITLKNIVFSPQRNRYFYKIFMNIQKLIKRKYIIQEDTEMIPINEDMNISDLKSNVSHMHKILQVNIKQILEKSSEHVVIEESNLDVIDFDNGKVVECGHTEAGKLFDSFNEVLKDIPNIQHGMKKLFELK